MSRMVRPEYHPDECPSRQRPLGIYENVFGIWMRLTRELMIPRWGWLHP